jgi:hypothetical protein
LWLPLPQKKTQLLMGFYFKVFIQPLKERLNLDEMKILTETYIILKVSRNGHKLTAGNWYKLE